MASRRYRELVRRIKKLHKHLLPAVFSLTGVYTDAQLDRARGYRLLAHAEMEHYLEERAEAVLYVIVQKWKTDKKPKHLLLSMLSLHSEPENAKKRFKQQGGRTDRIECAVEVANSSYRQLLKDNNGIKEANIIGILLPLGITESQIERTWLNTINSFGAARGETAHSSIKVQQPVDPKSEAQTVELILRGLEKIDGLFNAIK
jgi:hypothetical protein